MSCANDIIILKVGGRGGTCIHGMGIRSLPIEVFPLSFSEYLRFNGILGEVPRVGFTAREKGILRRAMSDYAERGGFPDVQDVSSGIRAAMLAEGIKVPGDVRVVTMSNLGAWSGVAVFARAV